MLVVSILEFALLATEPGLFFADFAWGMSLSTLLLFVFTFIAFHNYLCENTLKTVKTKIIAIAGYGLLFAHFFYGITFFLILARGAPLAGGWSLLYIL